MQLPVPVRKGYVFDGWFTTQGAVEGTMVAQPTTADGVTTLKYRDALGNFTLDAYAPERSETLWAAWTASTYTITYDLGSDDAQNAAGNVNDDVNGTYVYGLDAPILHLGEPTRAGYTFTGWDVKNTSGGQIDVNNMDTTAPSIVFGSAHTWGDLTLTAKWQHNPTTQITLDAQSLGAELQNTPTGYVQYWDGKGYVKTAQSEDVIGMDQVLVDVVPQRAGYVFEGYYTEPGGQGTKMIGTEPGVEGGTLVNTARPESTTWYANYTRSDIYTIALNPGTSDVTGNVQTLTNPRTATSDIYYWAGRGYLTDQAATKQLAKGDVAIGVLPECAGYVFKGYYNMEGTVQYTTAAGALTEGATTLDVTSDMTWYARWDIVTYRISYVMDAGINSPSNPTSYTVETDTITLEQPSKVDYNFIGWNEAAGQTTVIRFQIPKGSTGDKTVYANWERVRTSWDIVYDFNTGDGNPASWDGEAPITSYTRSTPNFYIPKLTRDGYVFEGWENELVGHFQPGR